MQIFSPINEIEFWGLQVCQHQLFIYALLVNDDLIRQNNLPQNITPDIFGLRDEALNHYNHWLQILENVQDPNIVNITSDEILDTLNYQNRISQVLLRGVFLGYLYPSLLEHMTEETLYFQNKLRGEGYDLQKEVKFWLYHHKSETEVAKKQLDPKEEVTEATIQHFDEEIKKLQKNPELALREMGFVLDEYNKLGKELAVGIIGNKISTITPLIVAEHAIREGVRAKQIFQKLMHTQ